MLSISSADIPLVLSLLPKSLVKRIEDEDGGLGERPSLACATLVANAVIKGVGALNRGQIKQLDANPGDAGCQLRALILWNLIQNRNLQTESRALLSQAKKIKAKVDRRWTLVCNASRKLSGTKEEFFKETVSKVTVSFEMEFILLSYLLWVLKAPCERLENGIVNTKTSIDRLCLLSKRVTALSTEDRRKIAERSQKKYSALSMDRVWKEAKRLTVISDRQKELTVLMVSKAHRHLFTPNPKYLPKTFGCQFFEMKTVVFRLREKRVFCGFRSIVKSGDPFHILFQSKTVGGSFERIPDEEYKDIALTTPLVVFEGVALVDRERFATRLFSQGVTETILTSSAICSQYEPTSTLESVTNCEAREEIKRYRAKEEALLEDFLILDHVFCNTLGYEMPQLKRRKK